MSNNIEIKDEDIEDKDNDKLIVKKRNRQFLPRLLLSLFIIIVIAISIILATKPPTLCVEEIGSCNDYPTNIACSKKQNTYYSIDETLGYDCTSLCIDNKRSYTCKCRNLYFWEDQINSCDMICIDSLKTICDEKFSGQNCKAINTANGGFNCFTLCLNGIVSYQCQCPTNYTWSKPKHSCQLICPTESINHCDSRLLNIPCVNTSDSLSTGCKTTCINNRISFTCCDEIPVKSIWSADDNACINICQDQFINGLDYLDGKKCFYFEKNSYCINECNSTKMSFKCSCPNYYQWNTIKFQCDMICPLPAIPGCSSANESITCFQTVDAKRSKYCQTKCVNSSIDYECECQSTNMQWSYNDHQCKQICLNENGNCTEYPDSILCIAQTDVNGGFNCSTNCTDKRSFSCLCPTNYLWISEKATCIKICPSPSILGCVEADEDVECVPTIDSNGGKFCQIKCINTSLDYECICSEIPGKFDWSKSDHKCVLKCLSEHGTCADYADGERCIQKECTNSIECYTSCNSSNRNYNCSCRPNYVWIEEKLLCKMICPILGISTCEVENENKECQTIFDTYNGYNCRTICKDTFLNFECSCPFADQVWSFVEQKCLYKCISNYDETNCTNYPDGSLCYTSSETYDGFNCTSSCNENDGKDFSCLCKEMVNWNIDKKYCQICPPDYTILPTRFCLKVASRIGRSYTQALQLCSGDRIHLPYPKTSSLMHILLNFQFTSRLDHMWLPIVRINNVWFWQENNNRYTQVTRFFKALFVDHVAQTRVTLCRIHRGWDTWISSELHKVVCQYDPL